MKMKILYFAVSMMFLVGCSNKPKMSQAFSVGDKEKLSVYLKNPVLLKRFNTKELVILKTDTDRVAVARAEDGVEFGEIYFTVQSGSHFKEHNEIMKYQQGKGWQIWER